MIVAHLFKIAITIEETQTKQTLCGDDDDDNNEDKTPTQQQRRRRRKQNLCTYIVNS